MRVELREPGVPPTLAEIVAYTFCGTSCVFLLLRYLSCGSSGKAGPGWTCPRKKTAAPLVCQPWGRRRLKPIGQLVCVWYTCTGCVVFRHVDEKPSRRALQTRYLLDGVYEVSSRRSFIDTYSLGGREWSQSSLGYLGCCFFPRGPSDVTLMRCFSSQDGHCIGGDCAIIRRKTHTIVRLCTAFSEKTHKLLG